MTITHNLQHNRLLKILPEVDYDIISIHLEKVYVSFGENLYELGNKSRYVYFPISCIISILNITKDGVITEITVIGNEGVVDIAFIFNNSIKYNQIVVQRAGCAYRISQKILKQLIFQNKSLCCLFLRYLQILATQMTQTIICNKYHSMYQRLCYKLL